MRLKIPSEYQTFARAARAQGWSITRTKRGHLAWTNSEGHTVFTPGTPSVNGTGVIRIKSKLRHAGLDI